MKAVQLPLKIDQVFNMPKLIKRGTPGKMNKFELIEIANKLLAKRKWCIEHGIKPPTLESIARASGHFSRSTPWRFQHKKMRRQDILARQLNKRRKKIISTTKEEIIAGIFFVVLIILVLFRLRRLDTWLYFKIILFIFYAYICSIIGV